MFVVELTNHMSSCNNLMCFISVEGGDLLELFDWLSKVWYHLNEIVEDFCDSDATLGIYI